jgi:CRISPR system Cascade subunit CasE
MTPLHLVQLRFDPRGLLAHARNRSRGRRSGDLGYVTHMVLKELFGAQAPQPFRLKTAEDFFTVLGYAEHDHHTLLTTAQAVAEPDVLSIWRRDGAFSKPMPEMPAGMRLGFELVAAPTRRVRGSTVTGGGDPERALRAVKGEGASYEVDAWVAERLRLGDAAAPREDVYRAWLVEQVTRIGGAELDHIDLEPHRERFARKGTGDDSAARHEHTLVLYRGTLRVTDPAAFHTLLARGIGRHRAFGLGMLLLRPV